MSCALSGQYNDGQIDGLQHRYFALGNARYHVAPPRMSLTSGARVGPYEILQRIGAGGMGEVYRARDTRLEREIAIKVLPDRVASDPHQLARFEREAQLLASLNHPHIVTIHSIEQIDALRFLTMELVDGQSLDRLIPATGMEVGQLLAIAISVADACSSAHDKGIIHRDLKPANVMVEATGRVKVLDFGLAKIAETSEAAGGEATRTVTRAGIVLGTVPYMSPEQAEGLPVDHRSDIFSLGVLLYEMATGSRPFHGTTSAALLSAILKDTPRPVSELRRDLPHDVERLINGCLAKSPAERIQTARDVYVDLSEIRRSAATGVERDGAPRGIPRVQTDTPWIVVMPFTQRRSDPELQSFADSLPEDVSDSLSRFSYQDDWKLSARVTLSLGLRWDYQAPVTERYNRHTIGFGRTPASPLQVPGLSLRGGLLFADDNTRSPYRSDWDNIQPRVSLSYTLLNHLILRSNYGRSFLPLSGSGEEGINQTGFSRRTSVISSIQTGIPFNTLDRPFPEGILQPANGADGLATNIGSGFSFLNPNFKIPYVDQWMVGFDVDLPWSVGLDIAYVGNLTRELPINGRAINEVSREERERAIEALGGNASYLSTQLPNPFAGRVPGTALNQPTASSCCARSRSSPASRWTASTTGGRATTRWN